MQIYETLHTNSKLEEMRAIRAELSDLNVEAAELAEKIQANFEELMA